MPSASSWSWVTTRNVMPTRSWMPISSRRVSPARADRRPGAGRHNVSGRNPRPGGSARHGLAGRDDECRTARPGRPTGQNLREAEFALCRRVCRRSEFVRGRGRRLPAAGRHCASMRSISRSRCPAMLEFLRAPRWPWRCAQKLRLSRARPAGFALTTRVGAIDYRGPVSLAPAFDAVGDVVKGAAASAAAAAFSRGSAVWACWGAEDAVVISDDRARLARPAGADRRRRFCGSVFFLLPLLIVRRSACRKARSDPALYAACHAARRQLCVHATQRISPLLIARRPLSARLSGLARLCRRWRPCCAWSLGYPIAMRSPAPERLAQTAAVSGRVAVLDEPSDPGLCLDRDPAADRPRKPAAARGWADPCADACSTTVFGRARPRLLLPAVHGAAALRQPVAARREPDRGGRRSRRAALAGVSRA